MKVSIITVSFNASATIEDTLLSVFNQNYDNIESIVIDGGSSDGTNEVISKHRNRISYFVSETDEGIYDAMNKGIRHASGDIIGILNSDDVFADVSVISDIVDGFKISFADACYGDLVYMDPTLSRTVRYWRSGHYRPGQFGKGWMIPHPALFIRSDCYRKLGTYREAFKISADYELMIRFIEKNSLKVYYLPKVIVKMRTGGKSNSGLKNMLIKAREDCRAWKVNGLKVPFLLPIRKPLSKLDQFFKR